MNKKLTTQEIEKLGKLKSNFNNLVQQVGNIEVQIMNLRLQKGKKQDYSMMILYTIG